MSFYWALINMSAVINRKVKAYIYVVSTRSNLAITVCRASDGKVVYVKTAGAAI